MRITLKAKPQPFCAPSRAEIIQYISDAFDLGSIQILNDGSLVVETAEPMIQIRRGPARINRGKRQEEITGTRKDEYVAQILNIEI